MWFLKKLINFTVKFISPLFPQRVPTRPATSLWTQVEHHLKMIEGFERELRPRDENFLRLLETMFRAVRYLAESDPYYQLWIGYFLKRAAVAYNMGFREYSKMLNQQAEKHPELPQLRNLEFQLRAWHLKLCGGLHLFDEELLKRNG